MFNYDLTLLFSFADGALLTLTFDLFSDMLGIHFSVT